VSDDLVDQPTPSVKVRGRDMGGSRPPGDRSRCAGGFTLLEVLIAITLTVALAAVVLPVSMSWLQVAGLDEAAPRVEAALSLARADAQRRGIVLEVVAATSSDGALELRSRELIVESAGSGDFDESLEPNGISDETSEETLLAELPAGIVLRRVIPGELEAEEFGAAGGLAEDTSRAAPLAEKEEDELIIALALPDGRIIAEEQAAELRAVGSDGRWMVLTINGWTGAVVSRAGVAARDDEASEPPEDPAEAP
jgi:type II secretory pathway pseudopilin PulG